MWKRNLLPSWLCLSLVLLAEKKVSGQAGDEPAGQTDLSQIGIVKFHGLENNTIVLRESLQINLAGGESRLFGVEILLKNSTTPDILINLMVTNPGGDSDVLCDTWNRVEELGLPIGRKTPWGSDHTQGLDTIFISRSSKPYQEEAPVLREVNGTSFQTRRLVCSIQGVAHEVSLSSVDIEVSYMYRELVAEEQDLLFSMCKKCCAEDSPCPCVEYERGFGPKLGGTEFCHEPGNVCTDDGHLLRLSLNEFNLTCQFPLSEISQLEYLTKLDLSNNNLTGDIEAVSLELSRLKALQWLNLRNNRISGQLASDGGLCILVESELIFLNLAWNNLEGSIPDCLFNENAKLHELHLDRNQLTGSIPNCSTTILEILSMSGNSLTGAIPPSLGQIGSMRGIRLSHNQLSGQIPSSFGLLKLLFVAHLDNNMLAGKIPDSLASSISLKEIWLHNNSLTGLPSSWETGPLVTESLKYLILSNNSIKAGFPMGLAKSPSMLIIDISENKFFGPLPQTNGLFPSAFDLSFSHNQFWGRMTEEFRIFAWLMDEALYGHPKAVLDLSYNKLEGDIPDYLHDSERPALMENKVLLEGNRFTCSSPEDVGNLLKLTCSREYGEDADRNISTENIPDRAGHKSKEKSKGAKIASSLILTIMGVVLVVLIVLATTIMVKRRLRAQKFEGIVGELSLEAGVRG